MPRDISVLVAVPGGDDWKSLFAISLVGVATDFNLPIPGVGRQTLRIQRKAGSILPQLRQQLCKSALQLGATHIFFVDTDQVFPSHTLRQMLNWRVPVVAANVAIKRFPSAPTARLKHPENPQGSVLYTREKDEGIERVWRVGTGVMLIETWIFDRIGPEPWFNLRWREEAGDFEGEDWFFCSLLEKAGINIYVDHGLSNQITHIGNVEFDHSFVLAAKAYPDLGVAKPEIVVPAVDVQNDPLKRVQTDPLTMEVAV